MVLFPIIMTDLECSIPLMNDFSNMGYILRIDIQHYQFEKVTDNVIMYMEGW